MIVFVADAADVSRIVPPFRLSAFAPINRTSFTLNWLTVGSAVTNRFQLVPLPDAVYAALIDANVPLPAWLLVIVM